MSFENGYNINDYIKETIEAYDKDNQIFQKAINILNIYVKRNDWPICYKEFEKTIESLIKGNAESIARIIGQFNSQNVEKNPNIKDWDKHLNQNFKNDVIIFSNIIRSLSNNYYDYINNPLGIDKLIEIGSKNDNFNLFRIIRIDGVSIDLRMNNYEIEQLIENLRNMIDNK